MGEEGEGVRNPGLKAPGWTALMLVGLGIAEAANPSEASVARVAAWVFGAITASCGAMVAVISLLAAIGIARLRRGIGVIARWRVDAEDWERFRALDAARQAANPSVKSDFTARATTPASGVEVIVGRRQIMMDGSYHWLRPHPLGPPELRDVHWLADPQQPEIIEFSLDYPDVQYGTVPAVLRVPVAPDARDVAVRVLQHFQGLIATRRTNLASRPTWVAIGRYAAVAAISGGFALGGDLLRPVDSQSMVVGWQGVLAALMMAFGVVIGFGAILLALIALIGAIVAAAFPRRSSGPPND